MRTAFVNPERCIGCLQCELASAVEPSANQDEAVAFLEVPVPRKRVHVGVGPATFALANRCRHCDPAPGGDSAGDIRAAGVYRSLMLRRVPVTRYGRRLVEPGFGMADIAFDALAHGPRSLSVV